MTPAASPAAAPPPRAEKLQDFYENVPVAVALCAPAVRMVVVRVTICTDGTAWTSISPVVALQTVVSDVWCKAHVPRSYPRPDSPRPAAWIAAGWEYGGRVTKTDPLTVVNDAREVDAEDADADPGSVKRVAVADWPADQDRVRLRPLIEDMTAEARRRDAADARK